MEELSRKIGDIIREIRKSKGMTQEKLADMSSLHDTYIGKIERGEKNLSIESLVKITKALDVSLGEFFNLIDPMVDKENISVIGLINLLKDRSNEEQYDILKIVRSITEMVDRK